VRLAKERLYKVPYPDTPSADLFKLDCEKECLWLTDYIYVTTLYIGYSDACLYIHCLHESIYVSNVPPQIYEDGTAGELVCRDSAYCMLESGIAK